MKTAKAPNAKVARPVKGKGGIWPWLFVAPLLSGVIVFYYYPIIKNFYLSFTRSDAFGGSAKWVGLENYTDLFNRPDLASATINTIIYTLAVVASIIISVLIAALIELPGLRGVRFYRTVFLCPIWPCQLRSARFGRSFSTVTLAYLTRCLKVWG